MSTNIIIEDFAEEDIYPTATPTTSPISSSPPSACCQNCSVAEVFGEAINTVEDPEIDPPVPAALLRDMNISSPNGLVPGSVTDNEAFLFVESGQSYVSIVGSFIPSTGYSLSDTTATLFGLEGNKQLSSDLDVDGRFEFLLTEAQPGTNPYFVIMTKNSAANSCGLGASPDSTSEIGG